MLLSCGHNEIRRGGLQALLACVLAWAGAARAQTDEIQVYDAGITAPGQFSLTWHNNFTPSGRRQAAFPAGVIPEHALNGVPEWAYGVTDWLEAHFAPATRIAYRIGGKLALALEHYADFGPQPSQSLFGVFDYSSGSSGIEFGVGRGLTHSADSCMLKLMLMRDL